MDFIKGRFISYIIYDVYGYIKERIYKALKVLPYLQNKPFLVKNSINTKQKL